jgi:hypothetical protein
VGFKELGVAAWGDYADSFEMKLQTFQLFLSSNISNPSYCDQI